MRADQPVAQCNHVLRVAHCPECGRGVRPVKPRGDTSGRHENLWPFVWGREMSVVFDDGTKWHTTDGREWVCVRGPR